MGTQTIHAAVLHGLGQRPRYEPFPAPVPGEDEAVVTVTAAALKPSDRLMAEGVHYAPTEFPHVVGLDGVGLLDDGTRVAFMIPQRPYGGMAEETLVGRDRWLPVRDGVDDVTAAAVANPGMAAWKTIVWEAELEAGEAVLVLGATGTSGRIAAQLATRLGARVVVAGRNQSVLDRLVARGADAAIGLDGPHDELAAAIVAAGPYDVVIDYLWGAPAEAVFAALAAHRRSGDAPGLIRYVQVGMSAGDSASVPAITLRAAPVQLTGSGIGGAASLDEAAAAYDELLVRVEAGEIVIDVDAVPLSEVEEAWTRVSSDRRVVFVP
jgi:NADPH:quinone reductase-like Zn-dependent oxidoreductase